MAGNLFDETLAQLGPAPASAPVPPRSIYDDTLAAQDGATQSTLRRSMVQAAPTSPTRAADVQQLSQQTGLPADVVDRNYDDIQKRARLSEIPYAKLTTNTPALAQRLSDPANAALMRDELGPLGQIEQSARHVAAAPSFVAQMYGAAETGYNDFVASAWQLGVAYGLVDPKLAAGVVASANARAAARRAHLPDYQQEFQATMAAKGSALNAGVQAFKSAGQPDYSYGPRFESTAPKGLGFLGPLQRPDGSVMSEFSTGVEIDGKEVQIPSIVPTLSREEVQSLLTAKEGEPLPAAVVQKATAFAKQRIAEGRSPFAGPGEQDGRYPELARASSPPRRDTFITHALDKFKTGAYTVGETLDMIRAAAVRPRGLLYSTVEGLASMVPMITGSAAGAEVGAGIGTAIAPGPGTVIGAIAGGVGGTFLGTAPGAIGQDINRGLGARGIDVTNPDALAQAYANPALMAEIRSKAQAKGVTNAAVVALVSAFAGQASALAKESGAVVRGVAGASDVAVQAAGMSVAQLAGEKAAGETPDVGAAVQTGISTLAFSVAESALGSVHRGVFSRDPLTAARQAVTRADEALSTEQNVQALGAIGEAVRQAPTTARVPEQFKALIDTATGGAEPSTAVYFRPGDWDTYWQSAGKSPADIAGAVMGDQGQAYYAAKATDTPLAIPLGDYVKHVATEPAHWDGLLPAARMTADGMTLDEAREYLQALPTTLKAIADEATPTPGVMPNAEAAARVKADVEQQLLNAGATPSVAKAQAQVIEAGFRTLAERVGRDPHELYRRYLTSITHADDIAGPAEAGQLEQQPRPEFVPVGGESAENADRQAAVAAGQEHIDVVAKTGEADASKLTFRDAVKQTRQMNQSAVDTEAFKKWFGESTMVDEQGAPRVVYHGTAHDFDRFDMAKTGKGRGAKSEKAFFFSVTPDTANHSAEVTGATEPSELEQALGQDFGYKGNVVYPVYLKLENPFLSTMEHYNSREMAKEIKAAKKAGHDGIVFPRLNDAGEADTVAVFAPEQIKSALGNNGTFDPTHPSILEQGARGRIQIAGDRSMSIELAKTADASTFVHETGHLYVEVLHDLASAVDAPADLKADLGTLRDWVGAEGDTPLSRDQHEQLARGFEAYLMEGKAPSEALRGAFYRFKQWLLQVYSHLSALNVELTPDVRRVFDRLLASHEEIVQAESSAGAEPLFDDPRAVGMTETQAAAYSAAVAEARQSAEEALSAKLMRQMRREQSKEWAAWRAPMEAAVTEEIDASPLYRAMAVLKEGRTPEGGPLPDGAEPLKLHRETVKAMTALTPEQADALVRDGYTSTDGVHPDLAAELFGFKDGAALVQALAVAPDREAAIDRETDARMQARHGDQLTDDTVKALATDAVRNEQRVQVLRKELEVLASGHLATLKGLVRAVTRPVPPTEEIRRQAMTIIDQTPVGTLRPATFDATATRAARTAREALLRGDVAAAFDAKRHEILAVELYRVAADAKQDVRDAFTQFAKLGKSDAMIAETRNLDLVNAARAVLARFGIGTATARAATGLEQLRQYDPGAYEQLTETIVAATANAGPYKTTPIRDFRALAATVDALWTLARQVETLDVGGQRRQLAEVRQEVLTQLQRFNEPQAKAGLTKAVTAWDRARVGLLGLRARMRRVEDWVTVVDNGREGIARAAIYQPVNEGAVQYDAQRTAIAKTYAEDVAGRLDVERRYQDIAAPELNYTFKDKHQELLGALLHIGNGYEPGSNGYKLLVGRGWGDLNADGSVDTTRWSGFLTRLAREGVLTKSDYDFVQAVWQLNESVKPIAQRAHKARFGRYFDEVTAVPFETPFGRYEGGYYPAIADPFITPQAAERAEAREVLEGGAGGAGMFPSVSHGFTNTRTLAYAKPLILDASMVLSHVNAVLRFAYLSEPVHAVARLVLHPTFRAGADAVDPATVSDLLKPFLDRAASQRMFLPMEGKAGRAADTIARAIRTRGVMQIVALNATVMVEQLTHFVSVVAHPDVDAGKVMSGLWRLTREPRTMAEDIHALSPYMATRESAGLVEAHAAIDRILLDPNPAQRAGRWVSDHASVLMRGIQAGMDMATWQAVFDKMAEDPSMSQEHAAARADAAVRQALGSYRPQDRAAIEGGNQVLGLLNLLYGFYGTKVNMLGTEAVLASRMGLSRKYSRAFALYTIGFMLPAVLGKGIKVAMGKQPFQEHDEDDAHALLRFWWDSQEEMAVRMVPFGGAAADAVVRSFGKGRQSELLNSPAVTMVENALHAPGEEYKALSDPRATHAQKAKAVTDFFTLLGMLTGTPLRPVGQAINVANDQAQGAR